MVRVTGSGIVRRVSAAILFLFCLNACRDRPDAAAARTTEEESLIDRVAIDVRNSQVAVVLKSESGTREGSIVAVSGHLAYIAEIPQTISIDIDPHSTQPSALQRELMRILPEPPNIRFASTSLSPSLPQVPGTHTIIGVVTIGEESSSMSFPAEVRISVRGTRVIAEVPLDLATWGRADRALILNLDLLFPPAL